MQLTDAAHAPRKGVGAWLLWMALAVLVQVSLGGITRLTDSGLSITEWKPLLGVVPPLDEAGWDDAFAKYQALPQYVKLKSHLSKADFKFIYFWEWFHRLWGRLLGVFFLVPLLVFWRRGQLGGLLPTLSALFVLGGLQGALGWFMVMSGLSELVYVSHLRLAAHFLFAMALLAALVWIGLGLRAPRWSTPLEPKSRAWTWGLLALVVLQLAWGAFTAGLKAALVAPTWPDVNGAWLPAVVFEGSPFNDPLTVQFIHRTLGLVLLAALTTWWARAQGASAPVRHAVLGLAWLQVALGVATLLNAPYAGRLLVFGALHQLVGTLLFAAVVAALAPAPSAQPAARPAPEPAPTVTAQA